MQRALQCRLGPTPGLAPYCPETHYTYSQSKTVIETFPNPRPGRAFLIESVTHEFTCVCPKTGQPDFGTIRIRYVPDQLCFELKSLKLFLWSFRQEGHFHEDATNRILDRLVEATAPVWMEVRGEFNVRGGIATTVTARHGQCPSALEGVELNPF